MTMMKIGTVMCDCGGSIKNVDFEELQRFYNENKLNKADYCAFHHNLCSEEGKNFIKELHDREQPDSVVFAACTPKTAGYLFQDLTKELKISPFKIVGANIREHVGWVTPDKTEATKKAKAVLLSAYKKANRQHQVTSIKIPMNDAAVVVGAGPAGIQAAQDLAERGHKVHLIDRKSYIGGNAVKLSHFFPSDDCAACLPTVGIKGVHQSNVRRCFYRSAFDVNPNIELHIRSEVESVEGHLGNYSLVIRKKPTHVDMHKCVGCGLCVEACPVEKPDEFNLGLTTRKAIYLPAITCSTTKYVINRDECPEGCMECTKVCSVGAIELESSEALEHLSAGGIILATGFEEYDPRLVSEYHYGQPGFQNVITQSELARFLDITGPTRGNLVRKNNGHVDRVVMILCAGSRSKKYNEWCSNVCCMVSLKHAITIKERHPEIDVVIAYMDIRAVGPQYEEYYTRCRELGVKFIRGRPSEVESDGKSLYVVTEDTTTNQLESIKAEMVVLSMSMAPSKGIETLAKNLNIAIGSDGFFKELYSKLRTTETKQAGVFVAGSAIAPADIPTTVTRAAYAASQLDLLLRNNYVGKRFPTAVIDEGTCNKCESCISICPYGAIEKVAVANPGVQVQINPIGCVGCGLCQSSCPVSAISVNYYQEEAVLDQVEGMLYDAESETEPIIVTFACWECAYASTDYIGQMSLTQPDIAYPPNIRIIPVQCTGNISLRMIEKTFELGADGVLIAGCLEDRCHYETGSKTASHRVGLFKQLLKQIGIDPRRIEKTHIFCSNSNTFVETARKMLDILRDIGKLEHS